MAEHSYCEKHGVNLVQNGHCASGAGMMLDSPPMAAVHRYAAEVKRVADAALGRTPRG
jgi:hypothetical protein